MRSDFIADAGKSDSSASLWMIAVAVTLTQLQKSAKNYKI